MDGSRIFAKEDIPPALLYNAASVVPMKLTVKIAHNGTYLVTIIVNKQIIQMNHKAIRGGCGLKYIVFIVFVLSRDI